MSVHEFDVSAVGFKFRGFEPEDAFGYSLLLEAEPSNEYDPNAIKLVGIGEEGEPNDHLGYIASKHCK